MDPSTLAARPSTCRIVRYGALAALVVSAVDTRDAQNEQSGGLTPDLDSPMHVHLWVFATGMVAGGFAEYNVPFGDGPGEWHWPPRV